MFKDVPGEELFVIFIFGFCFVGLSFPTISFPFDNVDAVVLLFEQEGIDLNRKGREEPAILENLLFFNGRRQPINFFWNNL